VPLLTALALSGCGGPIKADELERGVESLGALASEGVVLADGVARDRTKVTFTRVQARTLAEEADHEAEKLADARAPAALAASKDRAVSLAQDVSDALGEIQVRPADPAAARAVKRTLRELSDDADTLVRRL
jgi:hypothetical protein